MKALLRKIRQILRDRKVRRLFTRVVSTVAAIVVFVTTYALVLPAITLEATAACGVEEHQHDDSCWSEVLTCEIPESPGHHHDDSCYSISQNPICEKPEHQHTSDCYDSDGNQVCSITEHTHDVENGCYRETRELTCAIPESDGHTHGEDCYEKVLTCGKEYHVHSAACYKDDAANSGSTESAAVAASTGAAAVEDESGSAYTGASTGATTGATDVSTVEVNAEEAATAATTNVLPEEMADGLAEDLSAGYVPQLEPVDMDTVLNKHTGFYYFDASEYTEEHATEDGTEELPANSAEIENWKKYKDDDELEDGDLLRLYLSYTVPAGTLNETNQVSRYRLPSNIRLTDDQIVAINETVNGIAGQYVNMSTLEITDPEKYEFYRGAEAIEGDRTPDVAVNDYLYDLVKHGGSGEEYISAVVKAENVFNEVTGEYVGQDLIFIWTPYSIEKNQNEYDKDGQPTKAGEKITGWFACDFNSSQVSWEEGDTETAEDTENGTVTTTVEKTADVIFVEKDATVGTKEISQALTMVEKTVEETVDDHSEESAEAATEDAAEDVTEEAAADTTVDDHSVENENAEMSSTGETASSAATTGEAAKEEQLVEYQSGTLTASGESYTITLDYTAEAEIPADAQLKVTEITEESDPEAYKSCLETASQQVASDDNTTVDKAATRFFNIEIHTTVTDEDGQEKVTKIEPKAPVAVNIQLDQQTAKTVDEMAEEGQTQGVASDPTVLHFAEDGVEELKSDTTADDRGEASAEIRFETSSFSIYGVVYTVDFEYNGYMVSIPGDSSILLSRLLEVLGLDEAGENGDVPAIDLYNVKSVVFSNEDLVKITRIEQEATVNDILTQMDEQGVETWMADGAVVRTEDKSDEEVLEEAEAIDQMDNEETITGGDWLLTALQPFHSEETLTIEMTDGTRYVINVTDLDTSQNGVKPPYVTDTVNTIAEGITITMFDYGPEKLDNVNNTYNSVDNSGINKGHELKFYSYGTNGSTINNFTGGAYAMQGVVQSKLGADGYPVVNNGKETLAYLFDENMAVNGKTVVSTNANYLFRRIPERGMELFYDSDENYAYLDGDNFKVYSDTYLEEGADYENPFRIGFYPYNDYDNRYQCIHGNNFNWGCKGSKDWRVRDQVGHYNHHFGMKVEGNFYMTDDKMITNETTGKKEEMRFKFSGDDDMWVFIDGVLVLDIGGIHNPVNGEINFTTGQVTVSAAKTANGGSAYALGTNTTIAQAFAKAGKTWDDSPLSHHDIKIFYMERGGMYSNLAITMNLPTYPKLREVDLNKVSAGTQELLKGAQFKLYSDPACQNEVKVKDSNDVPRVVVITSQEEPKGRVHVENLIPGQKYYLKEIVPPDDHKLDNSVYVIEVPTREHESDPVLVYKTDANGNKTGDPVTNIVNTPDAYGGFDFSKVEEGTTTGLPNAEFTLYTDADCQTIAKDRNQHNLVATSVGTAGTVSFTGIPAGATYYMKETQEPNGYFPSSDVYRVVVSSDGTTVSVYKRSDAEPLFTNTSAEDQRKIENEPKADKTSVTVEKLWSDGAANHTGDTVEVTLYETHVDSNKTGGDIDITVQADNWYKDSTSPRENADMPTSGSITYQLQKKVGEGDWESAGSLTFTLQYSATESDCWKYTHLDLPDMENGEPIIYRAVVTGSDSPIVVADGDKVSTETGVNNGVCTITAGVKQNTVQPGLNFDATGVDFSGNKKIEIKNIKLQQNQSGNWNDYTNQWSSAQIDLKSDNKTDHVNKPSNPVDLSNYGYYMELQRTNFSPTGDVIYVRISSQYYIQGNSTAKTDIIILDQSNPNKNIIVPAGNESILLEFSSTPFTGANSLSLHAVTRVTNRRLQSIEITSNVVESGQTLPEDAAIVPEAENPNIAPDGITNPVTLRDGAWGYTWSGLIKSIEMEENGYSFTREYTYYVKETKVTLANGTDEDTISATYTIEDGKTTITNTVTPKTSIEVTKNWLNADGEQAENQEDINFVVHRMVGGQDEVYGDPHTIHFNTTKGKYETVTVSNLPTKVKVGDTLMDASYYVVETSPAASNDLTTYYISSDGKTYPDAADAARSTSETIVNVNSRREIKVTKAWYYTDGSVEKAVEEPPVKEIWFKLMQVNKETGADAGYYTLSGDAPVTSQESPAVAVTITDSAHEGTIFKLSCIRTDKQVENEFGGGTHKVTSWAWETLTFNNLPTEYNYYFVETAEDGTPLISDPSHESMTISYVDENGKLINAGTPIDASIPGNYTIKNTERRTSLYAEKIWNAANKDNLVGNEQVWFTLLRVQTDGNGSYDAGTLEETPGIGRFSLRDSEGWSQYFSDLQIAPIGQKEGDTYKYYQYFAVELGLLKSASTVPDDEKQYEAIKDLFIEYQTKGSGTGTAADDSDKRTAFAAYGQGVRDTLTTRNATTVPAWINANRNSLVSWLQSNNDKLQVRTWNTYYDGTGTLGIFNSSEDYLNREINIIKEWKKADGTALDSEKLITINADATDEQDKYSVEIQLMQRAKNLRNESTIVDAGPHDAEYGSTVLLAKDEVVMQSDLFHVQKVGEGAENYWKFQIPPTYVNEDHVAVNQLPSTGPFTWDGETYQADFEYYISEYRVYNGKGEDRTPHWTAACLINQGNYTLTLENYETTDLVVHKTWDEVPAENRSYVDENVKAVLYKVFRIPEDAADDTAKEDITELIGANYAAYDLTASNIYETSRTVKIVDGNEIEVDPASEPAENEVRKTYYEDYIRIDQPDGSWWSGTAAKDVLLKISNLDTHVRDYVTTGTKEDWKKYKYWIVEQEYIDGNGEEHPVSVLLHGNSAEYPKYQSSTAGTAQDRPNFNGTPGTTCSRIELGTTNASHLGAINTTRGLDMGLIKDDAKDSTKKLTGAKFNLLKKNASGIFVQIDYTAVKTSDGTTPVTVTESAVSTGQFEITDAGGVTIKGLMPGVYELQEKKAPDGYNILGTAMQFEINESGTVTKLPPTGQTVPEEQTDKDSRYTLTDQSTAVQRKSDMTVHNTPGAALPSTGGAGTRLYYFLGSLLIILATGIWGIRLSRMFGGHQ